jgi:predicted phage terminase large subunit-like protein
LILAGRGFGKTRTICEWARLKAETMPGSLGMVIGATAADVRAYCVRTLLDCSPPWFRPTLHPSTEGGLLRWPNGSQAFVRSADEPDRVRGPNLTWVIADELASWREKSGQHAWPILKMALRHSGPGGEPPQVAIATTPRPTKLIRSLLKDPLCVSVRGSSHENRANLSDEWFHAVIDPLSGTRMGRQEIEAEVLEDVPGALWRYETIESTRRVGHDPGPDNYERVVVGVDPAMTATQDSDETGIVVCARDRERHLYVLDDVSGTKRPDEWARIVGGAYERWRADRVIAERNQGGDMVEYTLNAFGAHLPVTLVHASRGKVARAEPVAALYERGIVHHVGVFARLEEQMTTWEHGKPSPDRMDALVWALWSLGIRGGVHDLDAVRRGQARAPAYTEPLAAVERWS